MITEYLNRIIYIETFSQTAESLIEWLFKLMRGSGWL